VTVEVITAVEVCIVVLRAATACRHVGGCYLCRSNLTSILDLEYVTLDGNPSALCNRVVFRALLFQSQPTHARARARSHTHIHKFEVCFDVS
jgi:hypothetical protein